jgi:peptide/nickel transport system substrate-binding protein
MRRTIRNACTLAIPLLISLALASASWVSDPVWAQARPREAVVAHGGDPPSMDPHKVRGAFGGNVLFNLFEGLTRVTPDSKLQPALATSWRSVDDKTWQFSLRRGVKFHNGVLFTADAVAYNFRRLLEPGKPRLNSSFQSVERVDILDRYTVNVVSKGVDPTLPEKMSELLISEPAHTEQAGEEGMSRNPVGTGPFRLVEWRTNQRVVMDAFPEYWRGKPKIDRLVFETIPEATTRIAALLTQRADLIQDVPPEQIAAINANPQFRVETRASKRVVYVGMTLLDWGPKELKDRRVRQALNHAVDVPSILRNVLGGLGRRTETVFRPDYFGYDPSITAYDYNPTRAKQLLAEAGYRDGFETGLLTSEGIIIKGVEIAEAVAGQLRQVGVRATVKPVSLATIRSIVVGGQAQKKNEGLFVSNYGSSLSDPNIPLTGFLYSRGGNSFYANPELDALIERARTTLNVNDRRRIYRDVQVLLKQEAPVIFMFQAPDIWGINKRLTWTARNDQNIMGFEMEVK